jgi:copper(I)-binding protein
VNRALRAATLCVALLSPVALSACSAGQVTQTATQDRDKTGAAAHVGDITVRQVQLVHPRGGAYDEGDDAEVRMAIVNSGEEADTLTAVEGDGFGSAEISDASTSTSGASTSGSGDEIELPADGTVFVGEDDDVSITLTDLDEPLTVGQYLTLTLVFENAGELTVQATVATPDKALEREKGFDFHQEEGRNEGEEANTGVN